MQKVVTIVKYDSDLRKANDDPSKNTYEYTELKTYFDEGYKVISFQTTMGKEYRFYITFLLEKPANYEYSKF